MKLIKPSFEILSFIDSDTILKNIEVAGRTCYKSEDAITSESAPKFIKMLINKGHESVLEHEKLTIRFVCDRGVSHEIVRHRLASFSQESTRYCNYSKDKFDGQLTFIIPNWIDDIEEGEYLAHAMYHHAQEDANKQWFDVCMNAEFVYQDLISKGWQAQQARSILPNSVKTEIVVTANLREWRTIFKQRTSNAAHPQMREIMNPLLAELKDLIPVVFDDLISVNAS